jgi:hypothetical protein
MLLTLYLIYLGTGIVTGCVVGADYLIAEYCKNKAIKREIEMVPLKSDSL